jgi:hypothetical protein
MATTIAREVKSPMDVAILYRTRMIKLPKMQTSPWEKCTTFRAPKKRLNPIAIRV